MTILEKLGIVLFHNNKKGEIHAGSPANCKKSECRKALNDYLDKVKL